MTELDTARPASAGRSMHSVVRRVDGADWSPNAALRVTSHMSPGLPEELFMRIGVHLARRLDCPVEVGFVDTVSGPDATAANALDGADLVFGCAPSYVGVRKVGAAQLVPVATVFDDDRNEGRPVYFSDVVVRENSDVCTIDDLATARWALNDPNSLSGYGCVMKALDGRVDGVWSGGHRRSAELVRSGEADAAAIDANVLRYVDTAGLRIVHTLGPHPVPPLFARSDFEGVDDVAAALAGLSLPECGVVGFAPVTDEDYPDSLA